MIATGNDYCRSLGERCIILKSFTQQSRVHGGFRQALPRTVLIRTFFHYHHFIVFAMVFMKNGFAQMVVYCLGMGQRRSIQYRKSNRLPSGFGPLVHDGPVQSSNNTRYNPNRRLCRSPLMSNGKAHVHLMVFCWWLRARNQVSRFADSFAKYFIYDLSMKPLAFNHKLVTCEILLVSHDDE